MDQKKESPKRKSTHMKCFDYSENHRYFITICTADRKHFFSEIVVGEELAPPTIDLSIAGKIAEEQLLLLSVRFSSVTIENYVIMPNHIHIILRLENTGGASPSPTTHDIICAYKSLVTRCCKQKGLMITKLWQRSYYEHIIRNEDDYKNCWLYIDNNPAHWAEDEYY